MERTVKKLIGKLRDKLLYYVRTHNYTSLTVSDGNELPFLALNASSNVTTEEVGHFLYFSSHAIHIPEGFPFDGTEHTILYVSIVPQLNVGKRNNYGQSTIMTVLYSPIATRRCLCLYLHRKEMGA